MRMETEITIRQALPGEVLPKQLLLLADPDWSQVEKYLHQTDWTVADQNGRIIGVCGLLRLSSSEAEIVNAAVEERYQGRGYGKRLILQALNEAGAKEYGKVIVRTGNSSLDQLGLYQKCGFRMVRIERDYFVNNYPEPIYENGIWCRDQVILEMNTREK
ncbi:GNAT family N-acetyltransferase [Paenibacillus chibensis]|uniref:GNAT family N-acetyltransferase n=2 Tax=Paenibacillus chibensis TaxID=59846 RepID=UPI001FE58B4A|nr:GNAT family N-acetyltransferase [Paenibacillus chibensis]